MRDRILFTAQMVCAILSGQKKQTRREVKGLENRVSCLGLEKDGTYLFTRGHVYAKVRCPYGQPGARLYVCETFFAYGRWVTRFSDQKGRDEWHFVDMTEECGHAYQYAADKPDLKLAEGRGPTPGWHRRPAIFMPRKAVRIVLEVVSVRVERLHDISEEDAEAEGVPAHDTARKAYACLWGDINGARSWNENPWVWVVEFKRIEPPKNGA